MKAEEILSTIGEVAAQQANWKGPLPDGDLAESMDSLQRLSLVVALEDRFRVRLDDVEDQIRTLSDLVRVLEEKTGG